MKKILTISGIVIAACVVLAIVAALLLPESDEGKSTDILPTATDTLPPPTEILPTATNTLPPPTQMPEQRLQIAIGGALGSSNRDVARIPELAIDGGTIRITWTINDNLTENLIRTGAQIDLADILEAIDGAGVDYDTVIVSGSFPMVDVYGNTSEDIVVSMAYSRETIEKIQWDGFLFDNVYLLADDVIDIHPAFLPE